MMEKRWYKLDNSAKIVPSMTNSLNTFIFRLTCTLKEDVDAAVLDEALQQAIIEFPTFTCTMKSGLFWHYLETLNEVPHVTEERTHPCAKMEEKFLFRLSYYKKRINLEVYHVLADGNGAMEFLKYIVACYLDKVQFSDFHESVNKASKYAKVSDDFSKFEKSTRKIKFSKNRRAYKLKFPRKENTALDVIEMHMSARIVKKIAHKYDASVTQFLLAVLILSIIESAKIKDLKRPIGITVPVNLRNTFPSQTTRNFFYTVCIQYSAQEDDTLQNIIAVLKTKFAHKFSKENLQELLDSYMILEELLLIRVIPNFLKDIILGLVTGPRSSETMALSNMGVISMNDYEEYIESFSGIMNSNGIHLTSMTYKDDLVLGFTTHFTTNEIEHNMVKILQNEGIEEIKIISNKRM